MCHQFSLAWGEDDLCTRFGVRVLPVDLVPHFSIAPGQEALVVTGSGPREASLMQWGLVVHSAANPVNGTKPVNARVESLGEKPLFRDLVQSRRCLVPATGFFEWKAPKRLPWYFRVQDGLPFAFAGLYDRWQGPAGETLATFVLLTTEPNPLVAAVHKRMPVILSRDDETCWLAGSALTDADRRRIFAPFPAGKMEAYPVSDRANDPAADDERVIRPVSRLAYE
jgi:putative SOS response-associated peptidase YedK